MARVVVTGCSGKLGQAVTRELLSHGRTGANLDQAPPPVPIPEDMRRFAWIDFTDPARHPVRDASAVPAGNRRTPPRPETAYSLAKHVEEQMAAQFCRERRDTAY